MRLLKVDDSGELSFITTDPELPQDYAILSHTWSTDPADEVHYDDIVNGSARTRPGYHKIQFCIERIKADGLQFFWIDTCCIDQSKDAELSEAIRSMYGLYSSAARCYALLTDVKYVEDLAARELAIRRSRWFTRGWTLQELLAPRQVEFFSSDRRSLGTKHSLTNLISFITRIPSPAIEDRAAIPLYSVEQRLSWQQERRTSRAEDLAYSMLGMFNIHMPIMYGEGLDRALHRLHRKLKKDAGHHGTTVGSASIAERSDSMDRHPDLDDDNVTRFFVPFRRDDGYIQTTDYLRAKSTLSASGGNTLALVGLGGVGKSQLAIEYCYYLKQHEPDVWILWVPSSTPARFDQAIRELAIDMGIPGSTEETADSFHLIYTWLKDERRKWIIILDSLDDADYLFQVPEQIQDGPSKRRPSLPHKRRYDYIPPGPHGSLLVTTRDKGVPERLGIHNEKTIIIQPHKNLAERLISKRLGTLTTPKLTMLLAEKLDYIPLAISQATAYIIKSDGRCTPEQYIAMLYQNDDIMVSTLGEELSGIDYRRDLYGEDKSILKTWQVSFEHIWRTRRTAAYLLALMSFYNYQEIPEWLVKATPIPQNENVRRDTFLRRAGTVLWNLSSALVRLNTTDDEDAVNYDTTGFEKDLHMLRDYSFVEPAARKTRFQMHRLVSIAAQMWLKTKPQQYQWWQAQSLRKLAAAFYGNGAYDRWSKARALYPHAKLAQEFAVEDIESRHAQATVLHVAAWFANEKGAYQEALQMIRKSREIFVSCRGQDHRDTLASMTEHAWTMWNLQQLPEAAALQQEILDIRNDQLGPKHPATVLSLEKLALTLRHIGRADDADKLVEEHRRLRRMQNGRSKPRVDGGTLSEINSLEVQFWGQGQWNEAETLQVAVLETCREALGNEHQDTLMVQAHLAATYLDRGEHARAKQLLKQCLSAQTRILGPEHPQTKDSLSWLLDAEAIAVGKASEAETSDESSTDDWLTVATETL